MRETSTMSRRFLSLIFVLVSGCATAPSVPVITRQPPDACITSCPLIVPPASNAADVIRLWTLDLIGQYGQCRSQMDDCRAWHVWP